MGRKTSAGTAHLEAETLQFRGDFRVDIPFERIREIAVEGDTLVVHADEEARFTLGAQVAERWMRHIKQPKGLFEKLEIDGQSRVAIVDVTDPLFVVALRERAASVTEGRVPEGAPVVFFGAETRRRKQLRKVQLLRARMGDAGTLWIVRTKGSKTISEADVLGAAREAGLVDTKVVAVSKLLTAHKCVVPLEMRGQARRRPPILTMPPPALVTDGVARKSPKSETPAPRARAPPTVPKEPSAAKKAKR